MREGTGIEYFYTTQGVLTFEGEWKNGKQNGPGIFTNLSGKQFQAEYKDGRPVNNYGIYFTYEGIFALKAYEGNFKNSKMEGEIIVYELYVGLKMILHVTNDEKECRGTLFNHKENGGGTYQGELTTEGRFDGNGLYTNLQGDTFEGNYKNGILILGRGLEIHSDSCDEIFSQNYAKRYQSGEIKWEGDFLPSSRNEENRQCILYQRNLLGLITETFFFSNNSTTVRKSEFLGKTYESIYDQGGKTGQEIEDVTPLGWTVNTYKNSLYHGRKEVFHKGVLVLSTNIYNNKDEKNDYTIIQGLNDGAELRTEGNFCNNKYHGQVKITTKDGREFLGEYENGKLISGSRFFTSSEYPELIFGEATIKDDGREFLKYYTEAYTIYEGYVDGLEYNGFGKNYDPMTGEIYEGFFSKDKKNGQGKLTKPNQETYEGEWVDDKLNEESIVKINYPNGDSYMGSVKSLIPHGEGTYKFANGLECKGKYENGKVREGKGRIKLANKIFYYGNVVNFGANGHGIIEFETKILKGEYSKNKIINGEGVAFLDDKKEWLYVGSFINGKKHGVGVCVCTKADNSTQITKENLW